MTTYPDMNRQIIDLLRLNGQPECLYAAARIEELEAELQRRDQERYTTAGQVVVEPTPQGWQSWAAGTPGPDCNLSGELEEGLFGDRYLETR